MQVRSVSTFLPTTLAVSCLFALALPQPALAQVKAQSSEITSYQIPAGTLESALNKFATQSKLQVVYSPDLVAGKTSSGLSGRYASEHALRVLLKDKNIVWEAVNQSMYVLRLAKTGSEAAPLKKEKQRPVEPAKATSSSVSKGGEAQDLEKIVVVGSRLGVSPVDSAMPIHVITREQIDRSGSGNIAQVLSYLSEVSINSNGDRPIGLGDGLQDGANTNSTTVQMRGMPRGTTLILINGRRAGDSAAYSDSGQFDLSGIPLALVDRIEVLPAGSSAIYGGDGLAGVINIVLRRDANGTEIRYRASHSNGYSTRQASVMWGKTWEGADLTFAATWNKEDALYSSERALTADQDFTRFGGLDRRSSGNPATVYSLAGCPLPPRSCRVPIDLRGNLPGLTSPYAVAPLGSSGVGLTPADFSATQGQENKTSNVRHIRSGEERYGFSLTSRKELGGHIEAFGELNFTHREVPAYQVPLATPTNGQSASFYSRLPASNPFNPFGVDVSVGFNFPNTGVFSTYEQQFVRGAIGIRGKQKRFDWEISGWQSRDKATTGGAMFFNNAPITAAVNSTDPATALNPFVADGGLPVSREILESFVQGLNGDTRNKTSGITAFLRGKPLQLPAGKVLGLIGFDLQQQRFDTLTNNFSQAYQELNGGTDSKAYFAEARVPIVAPREGATIETVALTSAMRRETSDRYENAATTETVGLEFRPTNSILLRSTYSTAFKPLLNYFSILPATYFEREIYDPILDDNYNVVVRSGGGAPSDLEPEKSKNTTIGLVYRPDTSQSLSLTYWDMKFRDRISYTDVQSLVNQEQSRPARVDRDPESNLIREVDVRQINIAMISSRGVDIAFDKTWATPIGGVQTSLAATYTTRYQQRSTPEAPVEDHLGRLNRDGWAPRWKIVPRVGWDGDKVRAMATGRYVSKYRDSALFQSGQKEGQVNYLGDFWLVDLNFDIQVGRYFAGLSKLSGANLSVGATNLFDRLPDFCTGCYSSGYDASQYDIVGRTVYAELRISF